MHPILLGVLVAVAGRAVAQVVLSLLNRRSILAHADKRPEAFAGVMDEATYRKSVDYSLAKNRLSVIEILWSAAILVAVITSGVLPRAWTCWTELAGNSAAAGALFLIVILFALSVPGLPLEWWSQFRLEARFGFNRSTLGLWIVDHLKGAGLMVAIGFPLGWLLLLLVGWIGAHWWIVGWGVFFAFQLVMMVLLPLVILPLFNKLTPLEPGELRDRLLGLAARAKFTASTVLVMDGSKRSGHSNAFFTGLGRSRRIVLFDTLIAQLSPAELEAVLAHEMGHYKRGHIPRMLALAALGTLGVFGLVGWIATSVEFAGAFGFAAPHVAVAFLLCMLLLDVFVFWFSPLNNVLSRRHEFEADRFARDIVGGPEGLIAALRKLTRENLGNLTPHPWFSFFYYSHPTLLEREAAMRAKA